MLWLQCSGRSSSKFNVGLINKYDSSNNLEEFIQVHHTVIGATGDYRGKANYLPMALSGVARFWLINLPE
jgi:hypothetical protein